MQKLITILTFLIFFPAPVLGISIKSLTSLEAELLLSGTLEIQGKLTELSIRIYIPQEGIQSITASPEQWKLVEDELGNRMLEISWQQPSSVERYSVKVKIKNIAKYLENLTSEGWFIREAKKETRLTEVNDEMRELAYGKESSMEKAVRLLLWIDRNMEYDYEALKLEKPTQRSAIEVWKERKGVSGEFSNLLVALLRSQEIPARVVFSYTLPEIKTVTKQPIGHGWAEAYIDGKWVPFDITFLQAGYLDAAHIKFANLLENNVTEIISYKGEGSVRWTKEPLEIKILNYTISQPTLRLNVREALKGNEVALAEAEISSPCMLDRIQLISCVDNKREPIFQILDGERKFWICGKQKIFFIFIAPSIEERTYLLCPLLLYDELGSRVEKQVKIEGNTRTVEIPLTSVRQVSMGERFTIRADRIGIFFSPNFTEFFEGREANITLSTPGKYRIYFYSNGSFGQQEIEVVKRKDFIFLNIELPQNVSLGEWFLANVTIKNMAEISLPLNLTISFQEVIGSQSFLLHPKESRTITFNLTSSQPGFGKVVVVAKGRTLSSYTGSIYVYEKPKLRQLTFLEIILNYFRKLWKLFSRILPA